MGPGVGSEKIDGAAHLDASPAEAAPPGAVSGQRRSRVREQSGRYHRSVLEPSAACGRVLRRRKDGHPGTGSPRSGVAAVAGSRRTTWLRVLPSWDPVALCCPGCENREGGRQDRKTAYQRGIPGIPQPARQEGSLGPADPHRAGQSVGPQDQSCGGVSRTESQGPVPLHTNLFVLVESGGAVVCENPARRHCPGRVHLARRSSPQTEEIHSRLRQIGETISLDLYRPKTTYSYLRNHRDSSLVNHKRVARLMREDSLVGTELGSDRISIDGQEDGEIYVNLANRIKLTGVNQLWVADITFVRLKREFVYLAIVLDRFSRRVVGWNLDRTLTGRLPLVALEQALEDRRPAPALVHHSTPLP